MSDLRLAARLLLKTPAFSLFAIALLALGIGANAIFFSAFDHILLRPLPVKDPHELIRVVQRFPVIGIRGGNLSSVYYEALKQNATALSSVFGAFETNAIAGEPAQQIRVALVTPEYFDSLGVPAFKGRALTASDATALEGAPPAVLSYNFWRRRFNASSPVGQNISLNGHRFVIVGVMPQAFNAVSTDTSPDVRVPLRACRLIAEFRSCNSVWLELAARLKPGVTLQRAHAEMLAIWRSVMAEQYKTLPYYQKNPEQIAEDLKVGIELQPLDRGISVLRDRFGGALRFLAASAALLQLIVCANLAGLLLARNAARARDLAVRLAVGAGRGRLVRQMLAESLLLTLAGAALGIVLAYTCAPLLVRALPPMRDAATSPLAVSLDLRPDPRVLAFSLAIAALTVIAAGLGPAVSASRVSLDFLLRGARSSGAWRGRRWLLILQIALCTVLLAGSGLLVRTFEKLNGANPGFDRDRLAAFTLTPSLSGYKQEQTNALRLALLSRVRQIPGVLAVATANRPLMRGSGLKMTVAPAGLRAPQSDALNTSFAPVSLEYFETLGMTVLSGRGFLASDTTGKTPAKAVVNQAFANRFFPGVNPLGRHFGTAGNSVAAAGWEIVGVVTDAKFRSMREPMAPVFYALAIGDDFTLYVRTRDRPEQSIQPVRQALAALDPAMPFSEIHTVAEEIDASTAPERLTSALASAFSLTAALLASVGIYGLFAFAVSQRRREIGIRMAVGATPAGIAGMFGLQALLTSAAGIALGAFAAILLAPLAASLLYKISPLDAASFTLAAATMATAALIASAIPAIRAALILPAEALRQE